jgi:hypothetical protein
MEMYESEFNRKTVSELKYLLLSFGLPDRDLLEKSELRNKLLESGRIVFKPELKPSADEPSSSYGDSSAMDTSAGMTEQDARTLSLHRQDSSGREPISPVSPTSPVTPSGSSSSNRNDSARYHTLLSDLHACTIGELRELCAQYGVNTSGCLLKEDLVERLTRCQKVHILPASEQLAARADHLGDAGDLGTGATTAAQEGATGLNSAAGEASNNNNSANSRNDSGSTSSAPPDQRMDTQQAAAGTTEAEPADERWALSDGLLRDMSVKEIKQLMAAFHVETAGCLEKGDMIRRLRECDRVRWVAD